MIAFQLFDAPAVLRYRGRRYGGLLSITAVRTPPQRFFS
jgi:hypothetical protein